MDPDDAAVAFCCRAKYRNFEIRGNAALAPPVEVDEKDTSISLSRRRTIYLQW